MSFSFDAFEGFNSVTSTATELRFAAADAPFGSTVEVRVLGSGLSFNALTGEMLGTITALQLYDVTGDHALVTLDVDDTIEENIAPDVTKFLQDALAIMSGIDGWGVEFDFIDNPIFSADGTTFTIDMILDGETPTVVGSIRVSGTGLTDFGAELTGTVTLIEHLDANGDLVVGDDISFSAFPAAFASLSYAAGNQELLYQVFAQGDDTVTRSAFLLPEDSFFGSMLDGGDGGNTIQGHATLGESVDYNYAHGRVTVNLALGTTTHQDGDIDTLLSIEGAFGSSFNDVLIGSSGRNLLVGDEGNDKLTGGLGKDFLIGGDGADIFDFNSTKDSRKGASLDIIGDFEKSVAGEKIDLRDIDAIKGTAKNDAFKFIGSKAFTGKAGELHTIKKGGILIVEGDINGDGRADFQIGLEGVNSLTKGDFIL